jgi:hypothetical protein
MVEILAAETAPERKAWLVVGPGSPEAHALARALAEVFERGGWRVDMVTLSGMVLKPGVALLVAEEEPPTWAESALRALQASGLEVKSAIGYRPYYEEKKRENPDWAGIPMAADQAFVIAVGPEPQP